MKIIRRLTALFLALCLSAGLFGCSKKDKPKPTEPPVEMNSEEGAEVPIADQGKLILLYTSDVNNSFRSDGRTGEIGYAALAQYKDDLERQGYTVALIDGGNALNGSMTGILSRGEYPAEILNQMGYEMAVPGNGEWNLGLYAFLNTAENTANYPYICCNFVDLTTGEPVFVPYLLKEYGNKKIAYLGISSPDALK